MEPEIESPRGESEFPLIRAQKTPPVFKLPHHQTVSFHRGSSSRKRRWRLVAWSAVAGMIDLLIMTSVLCLVAFLTLLFFRSSNIGSPGFFEIGPMAVFALALYSSYILVLRVLAGCTMGEWACGLRLGEPRHRLSDDYSLRVIGRFFIIAVTGFILLPVLSLCTGRDWAGKLCGLPLVELR